MMKLEFDDVGRGEAVLLLHGIPGNRKTWSEVVPRLESDFRVIVPDLLGFGDSPPFLARGHASEQAEAVHALLDALPLDRVHVVGFDFGGPVAIELYRRAPSRFASLMLIASNVATDNPVPPPLRLARVPLLGEILFLAMCSSAGLAMMRRGVRTASFTRRDRRSTRLIFLDSLRHLRELYGPIEALLSQINVPVTVVWGSHDPFFKVEAGQRTVARIGEAQFVLLESGHFIPEEKPDELAGVIRSVAERAGKHHDVRKEASESLLKGGSRVIE